MSTTPADCLEEYLERLQQIHTVLERLGITRVWLHGSRAKGGACELSDWDFLVEFSRPICAREYRELKNALQSVYENRVDVCSPQYSPGWFLDAIRQSCVQIYPA